MSITDILIYADTPDHTQIASLAARSICQKQPASVTGFFVNSKQELPKVKPLAGAVEADARDLSDSLDTQCRTKFNAIYGAKSIDTFWRERNGLPIQCLSEELLYRDMVVMAQAATPDRDGYSALINQVILSSIAPVLVTPSVDTSRYIGHHILIAWNGTPQVSRAVRSAMPMFKEASQVSIVSTHATDEPGGASKSVNLLVEYLSRHGIRAGAKLESGDGWDDGSLLLKHASQCGASMIVMGGWGHSRLREFVLGGTTRRLVSNPSIPVWLHH